MNYKHPARHSEIFATRAGALDAAILAHLAINRPAVELGIIHAVFRGAHARGDVNHALDRLADANRVAFVPTGARIVVALLDPFGEIAGAS